MSVIIRDKTTSTNQLAVGSDGSLLSNTDTTVSGNITVLNANLNSGAATAASAVQSAALNGASTATIQITGTWTGTLLAQVSLDNTNWWNLSNIQNNVTGVWTATIVSGATGIWTADVSGFQYFRLTMSASATGTAAVVLRNSTSPTNVNLDTVLTKGTQNPVGISVQDLKDSGRSALAWTVEQFAATTASEVVLTLNQVRDGGTATTPTSYVITSGKRLRLQCCHLCYEIGGTTVATLRPWYVRLRLNPAGAVSAGTGNLLAELGIVPDVVYSTAAALLGGGANMEYNFPDGFEFLGDGTKQFGVCAIAPGWVTTTTLPKLTMTLLGFEY